MPGYANWKQLYKEEYFQLEQEGYDVKGGCRPESAGEAILPFPDTAEEVLTEAEERRWKDWYGKLWKIREKGIRPDYPYSEPETEKEILQTIAQTPHMQPLLEEEYTDRIMGAVSGRCAGVVLGKPLEMGFDRKTIQKYLESVGQYPLDDFVEGYSPKLDMRLREDCVPSTRGNVRYVQQDDDIHYTVLALKLAEECGEAFTGEDIGRLWTENLPYRWFWCASRQAYYHYVNLESTERRWERIKEFPTKQNPWRECIDGQIRCDMWGYLNPGNPGKAALSAFRDCSFSLTKNGIYSGMFTAGCISAALTADTDVHKILEAGLRVIPEKSRLAEAVRLVMGWYDGDFVKTCDKIYETYGNLPFAAAVNNMAMVTLSLLYGNLDYTKTITTAVMCGLDTDCNAGTAGSIAGAAIGAGKIPRRWTEPLNNTLKTAVASFGEGTIAGVAERIIRLYKKKSADIGTGKREVSKNAL